MRNLTAWLLTACALALASDDGHAQVVTSKIIACSSKVKLQTAINKLAAGTVGRFTISGNCNENIVVPLGKEVELLGSANASITAANGDLPALLVKGAATVEKMTISASGTPYGAIDITMGGFLKLTAATVSANLTRGIAVEDNSRLVLINSRVVGGALVEDGSTAWIAARGNRTLHPSDGAKVTFSNPRGPAVGCGNANVTIVAGGSGGTVDGSVEIKESRGGIWSYFCDMELANETGNLDKFVITNSTGIADNVAAFDIRNGNADLRGVNFRDNNSDGIRIGKASVAVDGIYMTNTSGQDLDVRSGSFFEFVGVQSTLVGATTPNVYDVNCEAGSRIQYTQLTLTPNLLPYYDYTPNCIFDLSGP